MSIRHVVKTVAVSGAATICGAVLMLGIGAGPAGASTLTSSDGNTSLSTIGTVTSGTPYSSGQAHHRERRRQLGDEHRRT